MRVKLPLLILLAFVFFLCSFKIADRDFWWHILSGRLMLETHSLIRMEPFAYTRAGSPYLAGYEWLSQILLYLLYHYGGTLAVLALRMAAMAATFLALLWIDPKKFALNSLLAILAAVSMESLFIERPQLFTYVFFAFFLSMMTRALDEGLTKKHFILLAGLQALWVNLHGAACLIGFLPLGAFFFQKTAQKQFGEARRCVALGILLFTAGFASPHTYHNYTYLFSLLNDRTIIFINEWLPSAHNLYWSRLGVFWALAVIALLAVRRNMVFFSTLLLVTGYLSGKAFRHEIFFVLCALATVFYQLRHRTFSIPRLFYWIAVVLLAFYARDARDNFLRPDHLYGRGTFEPAKGAYEFLKKNNIQGNMFNTYNLGFYLSYRGYPGRQVFIDGRNIDHGFKFMFEAHWAGHDPQAWKKLTEKYRLSYALVDYPFLREIRSLPYSDILDLDSDWALVYLDDWVALYLNRNAPANQALISEREYKVISPRTLEFEEIKRKTTPEEMTAELERAAAENPECVKARLFLARVYIGQGKFDRAGKLTEEARRVQPRRSAVYDAAGALYVKQELWQNAAKEYKTMLRYAGRDARRQVDRQNLNSIFEKARAK